MLIFSKLVLSIEIHNQHKINIQRIILFIQFIQFEFVHFGFYCPPKNGINTSQPVLNFHSDCFEILPDC